jgi:hypothetical protein
MDASSISPRQTYQADVTEECIAERELWLAVITLAVEEWRAGTLRQRRDAQTFLFENHADYEHVCASAGLDPASLRCKLLKIGRKIHMDGPLAPSLAA